MTFRRHKSLRVPTAWLAAGGLAVGLGGCVAYAGAALLSTPIEASAPRGFILKSVEAIQEPNGVRFHGAACRRSSLPSPVRIRVDRVDANGQLLSSTSRALSGLRGHEHHCTFFDVPTVGDLRPGESARVCAQRTAGPCPVAAQSLDKASATTLPTSRIF